MSVNLTDYFDLKKDHLGPWNIEDETLVVRYANCQLKCPICYAAGPSYVHRLYNYPTPFRSTKRVSIVQQLTYASLDDYLGNFTDMNEVIDKLCNKKYVRMQGGEPLLNRHRLELTARMSIDMLKFALTHDVPKLVVVIQTNGIYLGIGNRNCSNAESFIDRLVDYANQRSIDKHLRKGNKYRVAIEISFKAPNKDDFAVFSGTRVPDLWDNQVKAYWNLVNVLDGKYEDYRGIAVYPLAGFIMPLRDSTCGIVPLSTKSKCDKRYPLFHRTTWSNEFEKIVRDFTNRVQGDSFGRYVFYRCLIRRNELTNNKQGIVKIRGEELELTGFQRHVPSIYRRYLEFKNHFDNFRSYYGLVRCRSSTCRKCKFRRTYRTWSENMKLEIIDNGEAETWRNDLNKFFYGMKSYQYYPNL